MNVFNCSDFRTYLLIPSRVSVREPWAVLSLTSIPRVPSPRSILPITLPAASSVSSRRAEAALRFWMLSFRFPRLSATTPLTPSLISSSLRTSAGVSLFNVSENARRLAIASRTSCLFAEEMSERSAESRSMFATIRSKRCSFPVTTVRRTAVVAWTSRRMSASAFFPSSVPKVEESASVNFLTSSPIADSFRTISSRFVGLRVLAICPPAGKLRWTSLPGTISTYFSPRRPCVWMVATESSGIRTPSWMRRTRRARFPTNWISSTFPIGTPAIFTSDFGSSPAAESKSTVSRYPFSAINPHLLTLNVKNVRMISPRRTKIPTRASLDIDDGPPLECGPTVSRRPDSSPRQIGDTISSADEADELLALVGDGAMGAPLHELRDHRVRRRLDLLRRSHLDDLPLVQHRDLIRDLVGGGHVVGDRDRGHPDRLPQRDDQVVDDVGHDRIQPRRGLVVQQDVGLGGDRPGQPHALLHAAGQLRGHQPLDVAQADHRELLLHHLPDLFLRVHLQAPQDERHVLPHVHRVEQGRPLEEHPEPAADTHQLPLVHPGDVLAIDPDLPRLRAKQPNRAFDEDRLAGAASADDDGVLPLRHGQIEAVEDHLFPEALAQTLDPDHAGFGPFPSEHERRHEVVREQNHHGGCHDRPCGRPADPFRAPLRHEPVVARDEGDQRPEDRGLDQPRGDVLELR